MKMFSREIPCRPTSVEYIRQVARGVQHHMTTAALPEPYDKTEFRLAQVQQALFSLNMLAVRLQTDLALEKSKEPPVKRPRFWRFK
jgi:hypothetical protein